MTSFITAEAQLCLSQPTGGHPGELSRAAQDCVPAKTWFCLPSLDCVQLLGTLEFVPNPILSICISLLGGIWLQWFPAMPLQSRAEQPQALCGPCSSQKCLLQLSKPQTVPGSGSPPQPGKVPWGFSVKAGFPGMGRSSRIAPRYNTQPTELCVLCSLV